MEFSDKKQQRKLFSRVIILLSISFFLGEVFGLYSISQLKNDLDVLLSTLTTEQSSIRRVRKTLWFYLPCFIPLIHCKWFVVIPVVLFCRGYLFSCSLAAISYINTSDMVNLFAIVISAVLHTMSLTVLSSSLFHYLLIKRKYIYGNIADERQSFLRSIFFALFSAIICCACEFIMHY